MFGLHGKSELEAGGIGEKRRMFKGPFQQETRITKRQNVSFGLPKVVRKDQVRPAAAKAASAKPAPAVYKHESTLAARQERCSVQFAEDTKTWNGLRPDRLYFDELVHQFFVLGKQFSSVDVLRLIGLDSSIVGGVDALLVDLIARIKADVAEKTAMGEQEEGVPVLLQGGGRGMKVTSFHVPYLESLEQVVAEAERVVSLGFSLGGDKESSSKSSDEAKRVESEQSRMINV